MVSLANGRPAGPDRAPRRRAEPSSGRPGAGWAVPGLVFFAVVPGLTKPSAALGRGALIGLLAYGAYDFTNQATLRGWPWSLTLIDLAWGTIVSGVSSWAAAAGTRTVHGLNQLSR